MCGRLNVSDHKGVITLLEDLGMPIYPERPPRYNVAPTQSLDVVRMGEVPEHMLMSWGFSLTVQGKTKPVTKRVSNARSDKVWTSPMWRNAIAKNRALVPVTGFYEWKRVNKKPVQAFHITPTSGRAMWFAGIYKPGTEPEVSIVTTDANEGMSVVHNRMPVILSSANEALAWLQGDERETLDALMVSAAEDALRFTPVSSFVNKSTNEGPQCVVPN